MVSNHSRVTRQLSHLPFRISVEQCVSFLGGRLRTGNTARKEPQRRGEQYGCADIAHQCLHTCTGLRDEFSCGPMQWLRGPVFGASAGRDPAAWASSSATKLL